MAAGYLPLACFGKHPLWGDYFEVGKLHASSHALKDWLQRGGDEARLERVEESSSTESSAMAIDFHLRILLALPGSKELLICVIRPSRDHAGRHSHFAIFTHLPRKLYGRHYALLPMALAPLWNALDDAWEATASAVTKGGFEEIISTHEVPEPAEVSRIRADYQARLGESAAQLFRNEVGGSPGCLVRNMPGVMSKLHGSGSEGQIMQLPVASELGEACFNTSLWIDLVNRQFRLRRFEPSVFLEERDGVVDRQVIMKFGALQPSDYIAIAGGSRAELIMRPAHPSEDAVTEDTATPEMTYAQLLGLRF